jgi:hypothetical protein
MQQEETEPADGTPKIYENKINFARKLGSTGTVARICTD